VTFVVQDTGIGIAREAQERIFREFEQAEGGATRRFGGTGLGLAISRRIVEGMHGRIGVESRLGLGSSFHFTVPLPGAPAVSEAATDAPDLRHVSVLIVSASVAAPLIAERLAGWGARTCVVPNQLVALPLLGERSWDVMLVDHGLGAETMRVLAAASPGSVANRIALITPGERGKLASLRDHGFDGYLIKPVRAASLAALLDPDAHAGNAPDAPGLDGEQLAPAIDAGEGAATGLSILVAEDNEINALLARSLLIRSGHWPTIAANGAEAYAAWEAARAEGRPYDVVLMDVQMPEMDGAEATRRIRAAEADTAGASTRIIGLSANAFAEDRAACLAAGMDAFLVKPLEREQLAVALRRHDRSSLAA
jgi:CheY-like chemotaxis protein